MPATPMKEAAERYSPEMAEAFQPTETERPATKKSLAVLEVRADRKPIQMVTTTVTKEKVKIILDLIHFLINDKMSENNVFSLENIMNNIDKEIQGLIGNL